MNRLFLLIAILLWVRVSGASEFVRTNAYHLPRDGILETDTWILAGRAVIEGEAMDDVFVCAAPDSPAFRTEESGAIILSGMFHKDVWALGGTIELLGPVEGHARFVSERITAGAQVGRSVIFLGNTVELTENSELKKGGILIGDNLFAGGHVGGRLRMRGRKATLTGKFADDVHISASDIVILPGTEIMGNLVYSSESELFLDNGVILHGTLERKPSPEQAAAGISSFMIQTWLFIGALVTALVLTALFPGFMEAATARARASFWLCALTGMAAFLITPVVIFFAFLSVIAIPPGSFLLLVFILLTYLGRLVTALTIGRLFFRNPPRGSFLRIFFPVFTGLVLLYAGANTGLMGIAVWCVATFAGMGAILMAVFSPKKHIAISRSGLYPSSDSGPPRFKQP